MNQAAAHCLGKRAFASPSEAEKVARKRRRHKAQHVTPYRCTACRCWHVGEPFR